ncbi:MAG: putative alternative RNA polymerase sigma factor SigM [Phycisphaerae bacterium]|nr:MAG: putative alternative RNA polymerase sigma factor SigM [Phycisphaerae bacterium]
MTTITPPNSESADGPHPRSGRAPLTPREFAERLRESHRTVWTIAASILNDPAAADDMVQEAAAVALSKLDEFDPTSSFAAWFGQVVRFTSLNESRRRRRTHHAADSSMADIHILASSPERALDHRLVSALEALSEDARSCLLLRTLHGMSFAEIATAMGIPEGTAMSHVHRARAHLRERLASMVPPRTPPRSMKGGDA